MAELATLARPYAEAVLKLAQETGEFARWSDMLAFLNGVVQTPQFVAVAANPRMSRENLQAFLLDLGGEILNEAGRNLVKLLSENRRLAAIPSLYEQYEARRAEHEGIIKVELVSTYAVEPQQKNEVVALLKRRFGKEVEVNVTINPTLLGGWVIRAGNQVIDLSVRNRLQQLANELRY